MYFGYKKFERYVSLSKEQIRVKKKDIVFKSYFDLTLKFQSNVIIFSYFLSIKSNIIINNNKKNIYIYKQPNKKKKNCTKKYYVADLFRFNLQK